MAFLPLTSLPQNAVIASEAAHNLQLKFPQHGFLRVNSLLMKESEGLTLSKLTFQFLTLLLKDLHDML